MTEQNPQPYTPPSAASIDRAQPAIPRSEHLSEAEGRLRTVIDHVIDGIITIDEHAIVETFNPAAEKIFGYRADEVIGQNVKMLMPEPHQSQHDGYVANYRRTGKAKIIGIGREVAGRRKDGSIFPMDLAVSEFRLGGQRKFAGILRDISERKRADQIFKFLADTSVSLAALVDYQSTLQKVAGSAVPFFADWCLVNMVESDGTLRHVAVAHADPVKAQAVRDLNGGYCADVDRHMVQPTSCAQGRSELIEKISDATLVALARDEAHLHVLRGLGLRSSMSVPLEAHGKTQGVLTFLTAESGHYYNRAELALAEDIAHRAAVAIENARLYADAKEADRRKDEFLAMLAHKLRNPLAPIRNGLDLMDMPGVDEQTSEWARHMMKEQVQHMVRLVDDLLDVSRIMRGKIQLREERVDLREVVARGLETARPLIDSQGHELLLSQPSRPVWVEVDPVRIAQVIANLLNNAAKYQDKAGHIWLEVASQGDQAMVRVRDDGVGIEPQLLSEVFELFTQAQRSVARSQGGLGIGLTLVRKLIDLHAGSVTVRSEGPGRGSEFVVRLPALAALPAEPAEDGRNSDAAAIPPGDSPRRRILVVDDNVAAAQTCAEIVSLWKHDVRIAYTGAAALEVAKAYHPDVVLLDIGLPGMSGYQVAEELRRQPDFAHTLLVAVTGYGQEEDRRRSRAAGFDRHLVKPVAPDMLFELFSMPVVAG